MNIADYESWIVNKEAKTVKKKSAGAPHNSYQVLQGPPFFKGRKAKHLVIVLLRTRALPRNPGLVVVGV